MGKKEKAFVVPPRSLFDLMTTNDLTQLCISVTGINPHDSSPGNQLLTSRKKLLPDTESETVEAITADDVRLARDRFGYSALHMAAAYNHPEAVVKLVEQYQCDVNSRSDNGKTPLWVAVEHGNLDIAQYLMEKGAEIMLVVRESESEVLSLLALAQRKQQHYFLHKLEQALAVQYPTEGKDPIQCAVDGDLNYFVLESDRIEGSRLFESTEEEGNTNRFSKLAFAKDGQGNSLVATIANQFSITGGQLDVVRFVLQKKITGDINEVNAKKATALHCLAAVCHEKEKGDDLHRRAELFDLLIANGSDIRRKNGNGQTPLQCTENVVLKAFITAEEKHQEYLDMYHKRNQISYSERAAFAVAAKNLKRAWRQARQEAESALANPPPVTAAAAGSSEAVGSSSTGNSVQATPRSARAKLSVTLQIHSGSDFPIKDAILGKSDPFCAVFLGGKGDVVFRTAVAPGTLNPVWADATTRIEAEEDGSTTVVIKIFDKDVMSDEVMGSAEVKVTKAACNGKPFTLPIDASGKSLLTVSLTLN